MAGDAREERRRLEKEALRRYRDRGLPAELDFPALFAHTAALRRELDNRSRDDRARRFAAALHAGYERSLESAGGPARAACAAGCSMCCYNWIPATAPEILLLAAELRARDDAVGVARDVAAAAEAGLGHDRDARLVRRLACPLLDGRGWCSVYAVRPLACRAFFSLSLEACRAVFEGTGEDVPSHRIAMHLRGWHERCMWAALKGAGLPHGNLELNEALTLALDAEDAEARWLAGEDVFAGVATDGGLDAEEELFLDVLVAGAAGRRLPDNPWTGMA